MKLSEIDTSVYYPFVMPSTQKITKFRPFIVKEEKALLLAQESEDDATMLNTLEGIVRACVKDCPKDLTTFDIEYAFLHIRSKSVGEEAHVVCKCTNCQTDNHVGLDVTKTVISNLDQKKMLKLSDKLMVKMKWPSVSDLHELLSLSKEDQSTAAIAASIETVYFGDVVFHTSENDSEEINKFLLNRTEEEISHVVNFVNNIPTVLIEYEYECKQCSSANTLRIESISDFF